MSEGRAARVYPIAFFLLLLLLAGGLSWVVLRPFVPGILWATVLAVALWPLWRRVRTRAGRRRGLAAGLFSAAVGLVLLLPAGVLGTALVNQASRAAIAVTQRLRTSEVHSVGDVLAIPGVERVLHWVQENTGLTGDDVRAKASDAAARLSAWLAAAGGGVVLTFLDVLATFVLTLFLLFFLLRDGEEIVEVLTDLIPLADAERHAIVKSLGGMLESIFRGSILCAIVQGTSGGLSWWAAGLPSAVLAGVAMGVLSLLPVGGTAIVWAPGLVALFLQGRPGVAVAFLLWNVLVTSLLADNVLKPLLIGRKDGELSTLLVFLGVFGGITAFGLLGVFVGPMALAVAVMLVRVLRTAARASRVSAEA